jgi:predicted alpha/beta superfamily hydrolase
LFDAYIAFDPSLWWNKQYLVNHASDFLKRITNPKKYSGLQHLASHPFRNNESA